MGIPPFLDEITQFHMRIATCTCDVWQDHMKNMPLPYTTINCPFKIHVVSRETGLNDSLINNEWFINPPRWEGGSAVMTPVFWIFNPIGSLFYTTSQSD